MNESRANWLPIGFAVLLVLIVIIGILLINTLNNVNALNDELETAQAAQNANANQVTALQATQAAAEEGAAQSQADLLATVQSDLNAAALDAANNIGSLSDDLTIVAEVVSNSALVGTQSAEIASTEQGSILAQLNDLRAQATRINESLSVAGDDQQSAFATLEALVTLAAGDSVNQIATQGARQQAVQTQAAGIQISQGTLAAQATNDAELDSTNLNDQMTEIASLRRSITQIALTQAAAAISTQNTVLETQVALTAIAVAEEANFQATLSAVSVLESPGTLFAGPVEGEFVHNPEDGLINTFDVDVVLEDFVAEATFTNPYALEDGDWDYGFLFRDLGGNDQYRLFVTSNQEWRLEFWAGTSTFVANGTAFTLNTEAGARNTLQVVAAEERGALYVNGELVDYLDLSAAVRGGDVSVGAGFINGNEINGEVTRFENFTVRSLIVLPTPTPSPTPLPSQTPMMADTDADFGENVGRIGVGGGETWRFSGEAGQVLSITVEAENPAGVGADVERNPEGLDTIVFVRLNGELIAQADDIENGVTTNSRIEGLRLEETGVYEIEVRSWNDESGGGYTLIIESAAPEPTLTLTPSATMVINATPAATLDPTLTLVPTSETSQIEIVEVTDPGVLDTETVVVRNRGATIDISGWTLSDDDGNSYTFPQARRLFAEGVVVLNTRTGEDTPVQYFWGLDAAAFEPGDVITLQDADGETLATFTISE